MCKGNNQNTVSQSSAPPAWIQSAYQSLIGQGQNVASQPLQQYTGPMVAGFTPQQQQAFSTVQNSQGLADPYINAAAQYMSSAATPINVPGGLGSSQIGGLFGQGLGYSGMAANAPVSASAYPYINAANQNAAGAYGALNQGAVNNALATTAGGLGYAANAQNLVNPNLVNQGLGAAQGAIGSARGAANSLNPTQVNNALQFGQQGLGYAGTGQNAVNAASSTAMNAANTNVFGGLPQFNSGTVGQYLNPYTQDVVNSTEAQFNNQNAQQQQQVIGSAIAQGAFGGDRAAVAQAVLAGQQQQAEAPVLAGLESQGYTNAAQQFQAEQQLQAQTEAQQAGLQAQTALGAGSQQLQAAGLGASTALSNQGAGLQAAGMAQQGNLTAAELGTQAGLGAGAQYQGAAGLGAQYGLAGSQLGLNAALGVGAQELQGAGLGAQYNLAASQLGAQTGLSSAQQAAAAQQAQAALQEQAAGQMLGLGTGEQQAAVGAQQASGWLGQNAGFGLASLGNEAQNSALTGAAANLNAGSLQQQLAQEQLNVPYEQYLQQQAYPYQNLNFLSGLTTGAGSLAGGTSSSVYPQPSALSQGLGAATGITGILGETGAFGSNGYLTGSGGLFGPSYASVDSAGNYIPGAAGFDPSMFGIKTGGRVHYDDGGAVDPTGPEYPMNPMLAGVYQNYLAMPTEKLQELAVRFPPGSTQGQVVRKALTMKQMQPAQLPQFGLGQQPQQQTPDSTAQPAQFASGGAVDVGDALTVRGLGSSSQPVSFLPGSRGIAIPQLNASAINQVSPSMQPGGGVGQWYDPLPQMTSPTPPVTVPTALSAAPSGGLGTGGSNPFAPTPGSQAAQQISPGVLAAQQAGNAVAKSTDSGLGSLAGAALGTAIMPGAGTALGALGGAVAGDISSNLFRPNSPAINDIASAQGRGQTITPEQWDQAGYGPNGAYLSPQQLLTKAPGQKNNAPLRDIAGAIANGKPITDAEWAQAGLTAQSPYAQQMVSALSPKQSLGLGSPQKRGGRIGFADGGDTDDDGEDIATGPEDADVPDAYGLGDAPQAGPEPSGAPPEQVTVESARSPRELNFNPPNPEPWNALAMAGASMMAGTSPYAMQNIGRGLMTGISEYNREKELDSKPVVDHSGPTVMVYYGKKGFDTGIPTEGQQRVYAEIAHNKAAETIAGQNEDINQQRLEGQNQQAIENRVYREQVIDALRLNRADTEKFREDQLEQGRWTNPVPYSRPDPKDPTKAETGVVQFSTRGNEAPKYWPNVTQLPKPVVPKGFTQTNLTDGNGNLLAFDRDKGTYVVSDVNGATRLSTPKGWHMSQYTTPDGKPLSMNQDTGVWASGDLSAVRAAAGPDWQVTKYQDPQGHPLAYNKRLNQWSTAAVPAQVQGSRVSANAALTAAEREYQQTFFDSFGNPKSGAPAPPREQWVRGRAQQMTAAASFRTSDNAAPGASAVPPRSGTTPARPQAPALPAMKDRVPGKTTFVNPAGHTLLWTQSGWIDQGQ